MSARYWVLCADELMAMDDLRLPPGLRTVERGPAESPRSHWWLFEDDSAPENLNGLPVELTIGTQDGEPVIRDRVVLGTVISRDRGRP